MKIRVIMRLPDEYTDPDHESGLTEEGYIALVDLLASALGAEDIETEAAPE